jgi:methylmalonyl-CoA mutase C-terminal domain/subunit
LQIEKFLIEIQHLKFEICNLKWRQEMARKIRVLVAKPGLDGHDRGAKVIARALRDAGMEVIYTGIRQTAEQIANAAIQEAVDIVGLSSLSGAHNALFPKVVQILKEKGAEDIIVFGGGIIPVDDIPVLKKAGIREIFQPGASTEDIIKYIKETVRVK